VSDVLEEEGRHIPMDGGDPVGGPQAEKRTDEDGFLVVGGVKGSFQPAAALLLDQTDVKIPGEIDLLE
jgi:hypothetical protein